MDKLDGSGFKKVTELIDKQTIQTVSLYFENRINRGEWVQKFENQNSNEASKYGYYADPLVEVLLKSCLPAIEQHTGLSLEPSYSFSRVYQTGEELLAHTDRKACEITATVNVACTGSEPWSIWMGYKDNTPVECKLNPGDAVIYKGCEVSHWRKPLPEKQINAQFMLHYVDKNGPCANFKYDGRPALGLNK
tara:strand:- start:540 stop:1115 length:576 start_codon:yes stop_codon:yes gene_type:complete